MSNKQALMISSTLIMVAGGPLVNSRFDHDEGFCLIVLGLVLFAISGIAMMRSEKTEQPKRRRISGKTDQPE